MKEQRGIPFSLLNGIYLRLDASNDPITGDLDFLNAGIKTADFIDFNLSYTDGIAEGRVQWNLEDGTLDLGMPGGRVVLQIGEEMLIRATNDYGAQIDNGKIVRISGGTGNFPDVTLADKSSIATAGAIAFATEDVATPQKGYFTTTGLVRGVNTSGMAAGSLLWLGDDGNYQTTVPTAPDIKVIVGIVIKEGADGIILSTFQTVPRLRGLSDVHSPSTPNDDDVLYWNTANLRWQIRSAGIKRKTRVTTTYQIRVSDNVVFCNTDGGAYTVTLPILSSDNDGESLIVDPDETDGWY